MSSFIDMTGKKHGKLQVLGFAGIHKDGQAYWNCLCDCGNTAIVAGNKLRSGHTVSCGCYKVLRQHQTHVIHGKTNSQLYVAWCNMKSRCYNPKNIMAHRYGARGISVCDEWKNDFTAFGAWALSNGYEEGLTLDRIDVNGNYCPENCRWVTKEAQYLNRSDNHIIEAFGERKTIKEWADSSGIKYDTIERRINAYGWSPERAVTEKPVHRGRSK